MTYKQHENPQEVCYPHELEELGNNEHRIADARYDAYRKMLEGLDSEDNPVIMIVKLKK